MSSAWAIAVLTLRSALRSRLLLFLALILVALAIVFPVTTYGDGTLTGQVTLAIVYTLAFAQILLGAASVWAGCSSIAQEIEERQIHMIVVKPVYPWEIWCGKWLGVLFMNAPLLAVSLLLLHAGIGWKASRPAPERETDRLLNEVLLVHRVLAPEPESYAREVSERYRALRRRGEADPNLPRELVYQNLERTIRAERHVVGPERSRTWIVPVPPAAAQDARTGRVTLRLKFSSSFRDRKPITGTWTLGTPDQPARIRFAMKDAPEGIHRLRIPAGTLPPAPRWIVTFHNGTRSQSDTAMFDVNNPIAFLVQTGTIEANLARAGIVLFSQLALLSALGVTAGTLFSFPVAAFVSAAVLFICLISHYVSLPTLAQGPTLAPAVPLVALLVRFGDWVVGHVSDITAPLFEVAPIRQLADGVLVSWADTGHAAFIMAIAYPLLLGLIGSLVLRQRELGLPGSTG